jgi:hypothetical protein
MASVMLSMQSHAQLAGAPDSLGLRALNARLNIAAIDLSIDLALSALQRAAPSMKKISLGVQHAIWGVRRQTDRLSYEIVFPADSGTVLERSISQSARTASINVYYQSNSADSVLETTAAYYAAASQVGAPDFCERDTILNESGKTIFVFVDAGWVRGDARVLFEAGYDMRFEQYVPRNQFPRFHLAYRAFRNSDRLIRRSLPERHDSPCFLTDAEILSFRTPLDSAAYLLLRAKLLARPTQPVRRVY